MSRFLITCRESHVLMSRQRDLQLSRRQRLQLRVHLAFCDACRRVGRQFEAMGRAARRLGL